MYLLPQSQLNTIQIQIKNISFSSKLQCTPTGALWRHWVRGTKTFEQRRWRGKRLKRSKCNKCQILKIMIHFCSSTRQKCFRRYVVINVRWKNKMLDLPVQHYLFCSTTIFTKIIFANFDYTPWQMPEVRHYHNTNTYTKAAICNYPDRKFEHSKWW